MSARCNKLFVYGTLRKGFPLHSYLQKGSIRDVGSGRIQAKLYDLGQFPGAVSSSSASEVVEGEVFELLRPEQHLRELDAVEGFDPDDLEGSLFVRRIASVRLQNGRSVKAWAYFLPKKPSGGRRINSGDYAEAHR